MERSQRGLTILGFLFVAAVRRDQSRWSAFASVPSYIEILRSAEGARSGARGIAAPATSGDPACIRSQGCPPAYIESVRPSDVRGTARRRQRLVASVAWQRVLHMIGNASILLEFDVTATPPTLNRHPMDRRRWGIASRHAFRQPALLRQALTHRSFGTPHNERLEFIGDAVLNCVVALILYETLSAAFPRATCRARVRGREPATRWRGCARDSSLGAAIRLGERARRKAAAPRDRRSSRMRSKR